MNPNPGLKSVRLKCACPPDCICKSNEIRDWHHKDCLKVQSITSKGDIFCNQIGCKSYFIKDARFQCQQAKQNESYFQFRSISQIAMAFCLAIQAAEFTLKDNDLFMFVTNLSAEVAKRWNS